MGMKLGVMLTLTLIVAVVTVSPVYSHKNSTLELRDSTHEINADTGSSPIITGEITNIDVHDVFLDISFTDYILNSNGTHGAINSEEIKNFGLSEFLDTGRYDLMIPAGETRQYEVDISIPEEFGEMTRYGLIQFSDMNDDVLADIPVIVSVGIPEYSASVGVPELFSSATSDQLKSTVSFDVEVGGSDAFAFKPVVTVEVHGRSGELLGVARQIIPWQNVLPASTRVFRLDMDEYMQKGESYSAVAVVELPDGSLHKSDSVILGIDLPKGYEDTDKYEESSNSVLRYAAGSMLVVLTVVTAAIVGLKRKSKI